MDCLIPSVWSAVGIISNLVAFMFFAVFTQKQPDIPLQVYDTVDAASSVLSKLKTMGKNAWITELDFHLLSHTNTIDNELREIFDYARFEKFWFTIVLARFTLPSYQLSRSSFTLMYRWVIWLACLAISASTRTPTTLLLSSVNQVFLPPWLFATYTGCLR